MLTPRENFMETITKGGKPDRFVKQYEAVKIVRNDPVFRFLRGNFIKGTDFIDRWGTTMSWPEDQCGATPHITEEKKVLRDISHWRDYVTVPNLLANCSTGWEDAQRTIAEIDRKEYLVACYMGTGIFEQSHFLMGFEDTLLNTLAEPEAYADLLETIFEYRMTYAKLLVENLKPDIILSHDDWGTKISLFIRPDSWRKFFKPLYAKLYGYMRENSVLVMHHADSYLEDIVEDMAEIGIDIWQGTLPSNDIVSIQKRLDGKMALMGGIDSVIDRPDVTEEEIRKEVRRACTEYKPGGMFIPSITYGFPGSIYPNVDPVINDEIDRCSKEMF